MRYYEIPKKEDKWRKLTLIESMRDATYNTPISNIFL
jgi:hypothetical protein